MPVSVFSPFLPALGGPGRCRGSDLGATILIIGYHGKGILTLLEGGEALNNEATIGYHSGAEGTATVDGHGSLPYIRPNNNGNPYDPSMSGYLIVGDRGEGTLNIINGGDVSNMNGYVGKQSGAVGRVTLDGNGSSWTNKDCLYLGPDGTGTMVVKNGGRVKVHDTLKVSEKGQVFLSNGSITTDTLDIRSADRFDFGGGRLEAWAIKGLLTNEGGTLAPGASPGLLTIIGGYTQEPGPTLF